MSPRNGIRHCEFVSAVYVFLALSAAFYLIEINPKFTKALDFQNFKLSVPFDHIFICFEKLW